MIEIYTDGSSRGNPGKGGLGIVILKNNEIIYSYSEQFDNVTNNQMELKAIIYAFEKIINVNKNENFTVYSDSSYCVNMCNDWIHTWAKNDWINSKKEEVKNLELVKTLYNYLKVDFPNFNIQKCHGHSGDIGNELADALASNNEAKFAKIKSENNIKDKYDIFI